MNRRRTLLLMALLALCIATGIAIARSWLPPVTTSEATWEEQLAAVRRGERDVIHVTATPVSDDQLIELSDATNLRILKLEQGSVSPEGLSVLTALPKLDTLWLRNSNVGDAAVRSIVRNQHLAYLNFSQAEFSDAGLQLLLSLPRLKQLRFSSSSVTEQGLLHLSDAPTLRWLHLFDVPMTDRVLQEIAKLDQLESLYIDHPQADPEELDAALEKFYLARPNVHVHINQQHRDLDPNRHEH